MKSLSSLTGILLIRGTMGYHFFSFFFFGLSLFFIFFFFKWAPSTPNSTVGDVPIFSTQVGIFVPLNLLQTLVHFYLSSHSFFFNQIFALSHAPNAIILRKSESFIFLKQKDLDLWSMIILSTKTTRINNGLNKVSAHSFNIYIL